MRKEIKNEKDAAARTKDLIKCIFRPEPKYSGEAIPVSGNGDVTKG